MKRTISYSTITFHEFVATSFNHLVQLKAKDEKNEFNVVMEKILPSVKIYISQRLNQAVKNGDIPKGSYKADDFINQLFIETYEHIDKIEDEKHLHPWLFKKADELLEDAIIEEEFDEFFFENIDTYSQPEWEEMEERFTTDGDGDLIMEDELDDPSYKKNEYLLKDAFIDNDDEEIIKELDEKLAEEKLETHLKMMVQKLPTSMRTVVNLSTKYKFSPEEIANIKDIPVEVATELLTQSKKHIKKSIVKRFISN